MKRGLPSCLLAIGILCLGVRVRAETEQIDLKALAKKARPAVMLLVVSDANGKEIATGTGFLVSGDGKLITNHHVIEGAASAVAKAENGGLFPIEGVLADDPKNDIVLLKLKGKDLPFLTLSTSATIEVGTRIAVIGSPLGLEGTVSEGIVSAVRDLMEHMQMLQITAAVSEGSSGSPVLDAQGDVIGIATSLARGGQSLNFATPAGVANVLLAKARENSAVRSLGDRLTTDEERYFGDFAHMVPARPVDDHIGKLKDAQVLARRYPEVTWAHSWLGMAYFDLSFYSDAAVSFKQAIKLKPDDDSDWSWLGLTYDRMGEVTNAIAAYEQSTKLNPQDGYHWFSLACAYEKDRRTAQALVAYRKAIPAYREATKLRPDDAQAWYNLGVAYRKSGDAGQANEAFDHAKSLRPEWFR